MLRGPQTVGELRGRTERMYEFTELADVEHCLESLATREPDPWSPRMPRGRWTHLLGRHSRPGRGTAARVHRVPQWLSNDRVAALEREVAELKQTLESFRRQFE